MYLYIEIRYLVNNNWKVRWESCRLNKLREINPHIEVVKYTALKENIK